MWLMIDIACVDCLCNLQVIADIVMYLLLQTLHEIAVLLLGQKKGTADFGELDKPFTSRYACVEPVLWPD